jgi:glycosyltransferase involved in cell wall biosynthesis
MKIAVCGAQMPFARGGAELLMDNLVAACRAAGHDTELVRLPVAWERPRLFDSALAWRLVPTDYFDVVIATNFPSYFVRHPNKVVWLLHQHRGAYDAADAAWSDFSLDDDSLETQRLLSEWDTRALEEARHVFTISEVVCDRLLRYNGLASTALYHPPPLADQLHPGEYGDYLFSAMRLEGNKRPGPLVDALAHSASGVRLAIAGTGTLESELRSSAARAGAASRLDLLGFVDDEALVERFAGALAVAYAPHDEDYGYVTLQAFGAGKPVITAKDSGGVLEWVDDGVNGIVTDGSAAALGEAYDRLAADKPLARRMGEAGRERVADLRWSGVVDRLLEAAS